MLNAKELAALTDLLAEPTRPLEKVSSIFKRSLANKPGSTSNLAIVLELMIKENLVSQAHQKLIAYYVMSELHDGAARAVPLFSLLVSAVSAPVTPTSGYWEQNFAAHLLLGLPKEVRS